MTAPYIGRPFVPVLGGPFLNSVCTIQSGRHVFGIYAEHLGLFFEPHAYCPKAARRLLRVGRRLCDLKRPVSVTEDAVSRCEDESEEEGDIADALHDLLLELKSMFNMVTDHPSVSQRAAHYASVQARVTYMPHTCFLDASRVYASLLVSRDPEAFADLLALVHSLSVECAFPRDLVRETFCPLFVPQLFNKMTVGMVKTESGAEEPTDIPKPAFAVKVFTGFGYQSTDGGMCEPWTGVVGEETVEHLALSNVSNAQSAELRALEDGARKTVDAEAANPRSPNEWRVHRQRLVAWDAMFEGNDFHGHTAYAKNIKAFFTTHLGRGLVQSQVQLITPGWSVGSVLPEEPPIGSIEKLERLQSLTKTRMIKFLHTLKSLNTTGAFGYADVAVEVALGSESKYGCLYTNASGQPLPIPAPGSARLKYRKGRTAIVSELNSRFAVGLKVSTGKDEGKLCDQMLLAGLSSPYNSTGFTEYGNLHSLDPAKTALYSKSPKVPLTELTSATMKQWVHEYKVIPRNEPNGLMTWFYNTRCTILNAIGTAFVMCWSQNNPSNTCTLPVAANGQMSEIIRVMCPETARGFFARVKAPTGTGVTFALSAPPITVKGYILTRAKQPTNIRSTPAWKRLEWMRNVKNAKFSDRQKYLHETYDVERSVLSLERELGGLYYKRMFFQRPPGAAVRTSQIAANKDRYVQGLVFLSVSSNVSKAQKVWCTHGMETTEPWSDINVYKVSIEPNTMVYSAQQIAEWSSFGCQASASQLSALDLVTLLLGDVPHDQPVTTDMINAIEVPVGTYKNVVSRLRAMDRYLKNADEQYSAEPPADGDADPEEDEDEAFSRPPSASNADSVLLASAQKRKALLQGSPEDHGYKRAK